MFSKPHLYRSIKVLSVFGTRPEAIKMAPVIKELVRREDCFQSLVCVTGQHRQMLDSVLELFNIKPDFDLNVMQPGQDLFTVTSAVLNGLKDILLDVKPDLVLVHGDTTTAMAASLAAYYCKIPVGHIEAGLRTYHKYSPFPEEINRRICGVIADLHFAPTENASTNLLAENVESSTVFVTGNTVIDALLDVNSRLISDDDFKRSFDTKFDFIDDSKKLLLVTGHRRENFGEGFENICIALAKIAESYDDVQVLYPVHLNPQVKEPVHRILGGDNHHNVHLIEPVDYASFVYLMGRSFLILTDSGGIQEEAPSLGKPVLVMRDTTERPEAVESGTAQVVGTDFERIFSAVTDLLTNQVLYNSRTSVKNPFGNGKASLNIINHIHDYFVKN